jgi:hypothetical protein
VGAADCRGQPLKALSIGGIVGQQIAGVSERDRAKALQLPPNPNTLTRAPGRQTKHEKKPRGELSTLYCYSHYMDTIWKQHEKINRRAMASGTIATLAPEQLC